MLNSEHFELGTVKCVCLSLDLHRKSLVTNALTASLPSTFLL